MSESSVLSPSTGWRNYVLGVFALLVLVVGSYWPSMHGDFLWDDDFYVTNNKSLRTNDGIEKIWLEVTHPQAAYLTDVVPQFYPDDDHHLLGAERAATTGRTLFRAGRFTHGECAVAFRQRVDALDDSRDDWNVQRALFVAAAIWALHPVQVESVAWITERKNVLSVFFLFPSLIVYLRFAGLDRLNREAAKDDASTTPEDAEKEKGNVVGGIFVLPSERGKLYALALILFVCSILSKSVTGTMPAAMLVLIWWKRDPLKARFRTVLESDARNNSAADQPAQRRLMINHPRRKPPGSAGSIVGGKTFCPLIPFFVLAIAMGWVTLLYYETYVVGGSRGRIGISIPSSDCSSPAGGSGSTRTS